VNGSDVVALEELTIFGVSGSLRKEAYSTALLRAAQELTPEGVRIEVGDIHGFPLFNQDDEGNPPDAVRRFQDRARAADAVLFVLNEHNYGLSAAAKNALDWGSRPSATSAWNGKPAGIMSASTGMLGGSRAQYQLRQTMVYLNMFPINRPEVIVPFAAQKFDAIGRLIDEATRKFIIGHLTELARFVRLLRGPQ
jgi:chromate reductase, NAD(P)H dehydrogenase (quinone)